MFETIIDKTYFATEINHQGRSTSQIKKMTIKREYFYFENLKDLLDDQMVLRNITFDAFYSLF